MRLHTAAACALLSLLPTLHAAPPTVVISANFATQVATTNARYTSWNIDPSCNRGFHNTRFDNPNLVAAATGLAPSRLRFGGSGADSLTYSFTEGTPDCPPVDPSAGCHYVTPGCLNATHATQLLGLGAASGSDFIFGVAFNETASCNGISWVEGGGLKNAQRLLAFLEDTKQSVWGFEVGNEPNNIACSLPSFQQAAFAAFADVLPTPAPALIGPDAGYRYPRTYISAFLTPATASLLHAVTFHAYNGLGRKNWNSPAQLDSVLSDIEWYVATVNTQAPHAEIWAGEMGPIGGGDDGTCGPLSICGTYASAVWYADELALRARYNFAQFNRQDLFGGHYGLVDSVTGEMALSVTDALVIRPDYWVNFLWKRTLGRNVFNVSSSDPMVRAYAFSGAPTSPFASPLCATSQLLLINLHNDTSVSAVPQGVDGVTYSAFSLTPSADGVFGGTASLNGVALAERIDVSAVDPATFLQNITVAPVEGRTADGVALAPASITVVCF
jgi:hypothetical protein